MNRLKIKTMRRVIFIILMVLAIRSVSVAETPMIRYDGRTMQVGTTLPTERFPFRISDYKGIVWNFDGKRLVIKPTVDGLLIGTNKNSIDFYDEDRDSYNSIRCSSFQVVSDARLKQNIENLNGTLSMLDGFGVSEKPLQQEGVRRSPASEYNSATEFLNFVKKYYPELIEEGNNGVILMNKLELIPMLVDAISELKTRVESQKERISELIQKKAIRDEKKNN